MTLEPYKRKTLLDKNEEKAIEPKKVALKSVKKVKKDEK